MTAFAKVAGHRAHAEGLATERTDGRREHVTDDEEQAYLDGHRAAYLELLGYAQKELGYSEDPAARVSWIHEREAAIAALRNLCRDFGDNDWDAGLNLADVIYKHLGVHLHALLSTLADGRPIREDAERKLRQAREINDD